MDEMKLKTKPVWEENIFNHTYTYFDLNILRSVTNRPCVGILGPVCSRPDKNMQNRKQSLKEVEPIRLPIRTCMHLGLSKQHMLSKFAIGLTHA